MKSFKHPQTGEQISIKFGYTEPKNSRQRKQFRRKTSCKIVLAEREFYGVSSCSPSDLFEKEKGRKLALKDAIQYLENKELRTCIWNHYLNRSNPVIV